MGQQLMGSMGGAAPTAAAARRLQQAGGIAEIATEVTTDAETLNDDAAVITEDLANVFADTVEQANAMTGQMFGGLMGGAAAPATAPAARRTQRF
jgi:hypothetical protein